MMYCHALLFRARREVKKKLELWICANTYDELKFIKKMVKIDTSAMKAGDQNCAANKKNRAADTQGCRRCVYHCYFLIIVDDQTDSVNCH